MGALVKRADNIRLAILGMVEGNGHPYSWSAIFNGYDRVAMEKCPYPVIPRYLELEPESSFGFGGARVTHIWTDRADDATAVAAASRIENVLGKPEDAIGQVDAAIVATDIGGEHVARCRPFVEAGIPVFIDKPLTDNLEDLRTFRRWIREGRPILSCSCMRYAKEYLPYRISTRSLGALRWGAITMCKSWERYGIHALEAIYPIFGAGFVSCVNVGAAGRDIVRYRHRSGADVLVTVVTDMIGGYSSLHLAGTRAGAFIRCDDTFYAFKSQLAAFIEYLKTGVLPFPFAETDELTRMLIAGLVGRENPGKEILVDDFMD